MLVCLAFLDFLNLDESSTELEVPKCSGGFVAGTASLPCSDISIQLMLLLCFGCLVLRLLCSLRGALKSILVEWFMSVMSITSLSLPLFSDWLMLLVLVLV